MLKLDHLDHQGLRVEACKWHGVMICFTDFSFAPHSQAGMDDAILHLCLVAPKRPTPVLSLLSSTEACLGSVISCGFRANVFYALGQLE